MSVGNKIKQIRKEKGLTQKQLGEKLGIKQQSIAMFENDKTNIKHSTLEKIAVALQVPLIELYDDDRIKALTNRKMAEKGEYFVFPEKDWLVDIIAGKAMELTDEARYMIIGYEDNLIMSGKYNRKASTKKDPD